MRNVDHTVDVLRDMIGQPSLAFNEHGHFELVFDGTVSVDVIRISDTELELATPITTLDEGLREKHLVALLTANYHGNGTGAGRVALDPRDHRALYCERFDVVTLEAHQLEGKLLTFLKYALYWTGMGGSSIRDIREDNEELASDEMSFIRI